MKKFRKLPVVIEAVQFDGSGPCAEKLRDWGCKVVWRTWYKDDKFRINTLEGDMIMSDGDWIIKGVAGEFYPCRDDIFRQTYEEVRDDIFNKGCED